MSNKSNYEYLLSDLTKLKGVGAKTTNLLKKRKLIIFLTCYGSCPNPIRIEVVRQK
jgi:hypothetical protein